MGKKFKTKKSVSKRIKATKNGKLKMKHSHRSHQAHNKSTKQKRHLKHSTYMNDSMAKRHKYTIAR
ncbi:MAG: 50S ribosomal protein L35 [Mycoplasmataceae bacterium]|jgi:large subunit ribosomal protein L35|nr:50S ribosomal protein L35 [Mycoplasmataceae bacterium]